MALTRRLRRCATVIAFVTASSAFVAPAALADKPNRFRLGPFEPFVEPPGVACPAAIASTGVRIAYAGGNQALTEFDDGRYMFTGRHSDEVTNVATGKSVVLDFHGSVASVPQADGSEVVRLSGTTGFGFFPGDLGPGDVATGRSYVFTGNVSMVIGASGSVIAFDSAGTVQDTCALIA